MPYVRKADRTELDLFIEQCEREGKVRCKACPRSREYEIARYNCDPNSAEWQAVQAQRQREVERWSAERAREVAHWTRRYVRSAEGRVRAEMLGRIGTQCEVCGWSSSPSLDEDAKPIISMHHINPVSVGGTNDPDNLVLVCPNCHAVAHRLLSRGEKPAGRADFISRMREALR